MTEQETRDIAVAADTKIDSHMTDCFAVRVRIEKALDDIRDDLKRINWYLPSIVGGIVALSKALDYFMVHK